VLAFDDDDIVDDDDDDAAAAAADDAALALLMLDNVSNGIDSNGRLGASPRCNASHSFRYFS
jgi:hypothetical protein